MPQLEPLTADDDRIADPLLEDLVASFGYRPNALLTLARKPGLLPVLMDLVQLVARDEAQVSVEMRFLAACEASRRAGCLYSACHAAHALLHSGTAPEKIAALEHFPTSSLFSDRERAALHLARAGGTLPVTGAQVAFDAARTVLDEAEIIDVLAVVALFGWFNRWNSLVGSALEPIPAAVIPEIPWLQKMRAVSEASQP
ncbi:carboxymuconolactone decarboxylase family protein [Chachezhania sediminis]|uniref:carboxymuconolactone decarboxylase family protein n=1 Tax=Chachezhania sediminis TaxID=2599291 RepID=UPI00131D5618|nr:carboxymuconolactone decarboxylase family protein [Chachezhania sediminis]